jgi:hypothetical protein
MSRTIAILALLLSGTVLLSACGGKNPSSMDYRDEGYSRGEAVSREGGHPNEFGQPANDEGNLRQPRTGRSEQDTGDIRQGSVKGVDQKAPEAKDPVNDPYKAQPGTNPQ